MLPGPNLQVVSFNIVCATLGSFIAIFGLVSYLLKERFYLSESFVSLIAGVIFSPHATNLIRPLEYALNDQETLNTITLYFVRLVLGVQLVLAGVQLPSKYLKTEWKSLSLLLGPGMTAMWVCTSLLVWAFVPRIGFLYALAVGACVTPTDPVLSNTIVKGKFADKNIPKELQKIIIAESGTNDGLGYPFLFLPLYLIKYVMEGGKGSGGTAGTAIGLWFSDTWCYQILLSIVYGATVGWIAKEMLHWAEERRYVDRESFLVFAVALALFILGTCGMIGSDDVLACFIAGNSFTWDDWFRQETMDDSLQPTVDMLLNVAVFIWFGAVCPWYMFAVNNVIPIYRLIFLGILVLLLRRPPVVLLMHKHIHQIDEWRQALFVGYFGPIGVSAIFYLYMSLEFLKESIQVEDHEREDAERLGEIMTVVIWFLVICSIVVHGLSIPLGKLGFYIPRTISEALSTHNSSAGSYHIDTSPKDTGIFRPSDRPGSGIPVPQGVYRIGKNMIRNRSANTSKNTSRKGSRAASPHKASGALHSECHELCDYDIERSAEGTWNQPKDKDRPSSATEKAGETSSLCEPESPQLRPGAPTHLHPMHPLTGSGEDESPRLPGEGHHDHHSAYLSPPASPPASPTASGPLSRSIQFSDERPPGHGQPKPAV